MRGDESLCRAVGEFLRVLKWIQLGRSLCVLIMYHAGSKAHCITLFFFRSTDGAVSAVRDTNISCHHIGVLYRGGPAARGELSSHEKGSAGREAVRLCSAQLCQSRQAARARRPACLGSCQHHGTRARCGGATGHFMIRMSNSTHSFGMSTHEYE